MADTNATAEDPADRSFAQIRREPRLSDRVADSLTEAILERQFVPGDRLPSERALMQQFNVSRTVVREAIRSVIATGLVTVEERKGLTVSSVTSETISRSMALYLRDQGDLDYSKLSDVRAVLELATVYRAAERASDADIDSLREALESMDAARDADEAASADLEFHNAIARTTRNEFFVAMLNSIREALLHAQRPALSQPETIAYVRAAHQSIFDLIAARDAEGARREMLKHLQEAERRLTPLHKSG